LESVLPTHAGDSANRLAHKIADRFVGFDERIIAMYARGMSVREIQAFLAEAYGTEVSPDFISSASSSRRPSRARCLPFRKVC
jgi:hypothetical protein